MQAKLDDHSQEVIRVEVVNVAGPQSGLHTKPPVYEIRASRFPERLRAEEKKQEGVVHIPGQVDEGPQSQSGSETIKSKSSARGGQAGLYSGAPAASGVGTVRAQVPAQAAPQTVEEPRAIGLLSS